MDPIGLIKLTPFQFAAVVALFLPGWVSLRVDRLIHPQRDATAGQNLIEIIGYSLLNAGLLCWILIPTAAQFTSPVPDFGSLAGPAILVCLVGPAFWPISFRLAQRWAARRRWIVGPYRTAWDDFFGRRQPVWIVAHMSDGSLLGGYFGSGSVASMGSEAGHLYITASSSLQHPTRKVQFSDQPTMCGSKSVGTIYELISATATTRRA